MGQSAPANLRRSMPSIKCKVQNCHLIGGNSSTALAALDKHQNVTTLLIDEFNPRRINLKKLAQHERAPRLVVFVAHAVVAA